MRTASTLMFIVLLALAGGCNDDPATTAAAGNDSAPAASVQAQAAQELTPEQLGELGAEIRKTPDRATELLTARGLDQQSFEAQIRKVTEDPDASKRYAAAYRKASA